MKAGIRAGVINVNASTGANDFTGGAAMATPVAIGHAVNNSASSIAMTTTANVPAGATIVVAVAFAQSTSSSITSLTDGVNTYTKQAGGWINANPDVCTEMWTTGPIGAQLNAGATITATFSQASDAFGNFISAAQVPQGMSATADRINGSNPNGTNDPVISVPGALNYPTEYVFGVVICYCAGTAAFTEKNNFTSLDSRATGFGRYYDWGYLKISKNYGAKPYYAVHITAGTQPYVNCVLATFPASFTSNGTGTDSYLLKADTNSNWLTALHALADTII